MFISFIINCASKYVRKIIEKLICMQQQNAFKYDVLVFVIED